MKTSEPKTVGELIEQAIDRAGARTAFDAQRICYLWPEVVGPGVNRQTSRRWFDTPSGTLHVCITSAPLRSELAFMASKIADRLNDIAGKQLVKRVVFH